MGPLAMIVFGIRILPLINNLKRAIPDGTNPWYADYAVALGTLSRLETYVDSLIHQGWEGGITPEPTNIVLIVLPDNLEAVKVFGACHIFRVCTGTPYIGGYIGDNNYKDDWLRERTLTWEKDIKTISKTAGKYPQESYAALVRAIQSEWIFISRVTWDIGD